MKKIKEKDKIFIYVENTAESWLFISYFLNICNYKNIKIFFFKWWVATALNWEKYNLTLWTLNYKELDNIFRNWEILNEEKKNFLKILF